MEPIRAPTAPTTRRATIRPPRPPRKTVFPSGPKELGLRRSPIVLGGPGDPPPGFLNGKNSRSEWPVYWGLLRLKGPHGVAWFYQKAQGEHLPGGAIVDFVVRDQNPRLALRVQTERFHIAVPFQKQASDEQQRLQLEQWGFRVIDLWEHEYVRDPTGRAVLAVLTDALQGVQHPSPLTAGYTAVRAA